MTIDQLQKFNGAGVQIRMDGEEALSVLFFHETGAAYLTSFCYLEPYRECPEIRHILSDEEVATLVPKAYNHLLSQVKLSTRPDACTLQEANALRRREDEQLLRGCAAQVRCRNLNMAPRDGRRDGDALRREQRVLRGGAERGVGRNMWRLWQAGLIR